ncbi:MAG: hypothetical protein HY287_17515 [Planctomycetes bacterium]|nr:hypothetical protein [Planctomycetota bacterium]
MAVVEHSVGSYKIDDHDNLCGEWIGYAEFEGATLADFSGQGLSAILEDVIHIKEYDVSTHGTLLLPRVWNEGNGGERNSRRPGPDVKKCGNDGLGRRAIQIRVLQGHEKRLGPRQFTQFSLTVMAEFGLVRNFSWKRRPSVPFA